MTSDLTILCVSKGEPYTKEFFRHFMLVADEIGAEVVLALDHPSESGSVSEMWTAKNVRWIRVKSSGFIESVLDEAISKCRTKFVLRLDDDEKCSPALVRWLKEGKYLAASHWKFPRVHLWKDQHTFINAVPLWPDHQTRLSLKELSGGRTTVHAGSPFGGGTLCPHPIEHHKFLVKDHAERLAIATRYEAVQAGAGSQGMLAFNDPEAYYSMSLPLSPYGETDVVNNALTVAGTIGMHQHDEEIRPFAEWLATRQPHHVIEIGTLKGGTAALWHELCTGTVVSVDLPSGRFGGADHGYNEEAVLKRNQTLQNKFHRLHCLSANSHSKETPELVHYLLKEEQADFLFIDGDHTYEGVKADFEMYAPLVRPGGIIALHDVLDTPVHRSAGCYVNKFWNELPPHKALFSCNGPWGGIGVTFR